MKKFLMTFLLIVTIKSYSQYTTLYNFNLGNTSGNTSLIISGNIIYGTTIYGGANNGGFIFSMNIDGTGFTNLHDFSNSYTIPCGSLLYDNGVLYGMTSQGGSYNYGTIFSININGSGYTTLHTFSGIGTDGSTPEGSLIIFGNKLFGMTRKGGTNALGYGIIFSMNTNGTNFTNLYNFTSVANYPYGSLTLIGNALYGMTSNTGINNNSGNVFMINTDGTGYLSLHDFSGADGSQPNGSLIQIGNFLYGVTVFGGSNGNGTIFKINVNGSGFQKLFDFQNNPLGSLTLVGNVLYGETATNLFSINLDGTGYTWYNTNTYAQNGGISCNINLYLNNGLLYGKTCCLGSNFNGIVFSFTPTLTGIKEIFEDTGVEIYPNPSNSIINIKLNDSFLNGSYTLKVTNSLGQVLLTNEIKQQKSSVDLSALSTGIYFTSLMDSHCNIICSKKIILH